MDEPCLITKEVCPESSRCPCWHTLVMENAQTGEMKPVSDCLYRLMPVFFVEMIKAGNRPAAALESLRNIALAAPARKPELPRNG